MDTKSTSFLAGVGGGGGLLPWGELHLPTVVAKGKTRINLGHTVLSIGGFQFF